MNKIRILPLFIFLAVFFSCSTGTDMDVTSKPVLVKEGFLSNNEYEIVCNGYPKEGLTSPQREESAKRAAILNAYYFSNERFGEAVRPDQDGRIAKLTMYDGYCEIQYIIKKSNLKNLKKINDKAKEEKAKEQKVNDKSNDQKVDDQPIEESTKE